MNVIVVLENPGSPDLVVVHAATSDPDLPSSPGPVTACGLDTAEMVRNSWQPTEPGQHWWPPELRSRTCPRCDQAIRIA
ncbi:hypothetical protein ABZW30_42080 [Kitasatospora sp. NPDC004669]|uniref:hypothetical protein n=1 Tax=Kitasatospora sp. NPDC004669 TaxID=3154555 RepID=UPI0033B1EF7F